ncbi:cytochrome P450 [Amylostereum chailletii]|nr:cytochrome P450 [Amylostereum chailletii]
MTDEEPLSIPTLFGLLSILFVATRWYNLKDDLEHIPTVGYSNPILSYITAIKFFFYADDIIGEGYRKYKPGIFKIPTLLSWKVVAVGTDLVEDIRKAPESVLSFEEAILDIVQTDYTMGPEIQHNPYHVPIIRTQLTKNLAIVFPQMRDELVSAFTDAIPTVADEWVKVHATPAIQTIACRVTNRVFVGLPLCRNEDYQKLNIQFTVDVIIGARIINWFPKFLKPIAGRLFTRVHSQTRRVISHLGPIIEERQRMLDEHDDDWDGKPKDLLTWIMDEARGEERSISNLTRRIMVVNVAAVHTTSLSFLQILYRVAAHPEYMKPLRDEVETVVTAEGWTKASMNKLVKIDSFIRESQRMDGLGSLSMSRVAVKPFTFSNGVTIPAGPTVYCAPFATHHDEDLYEDPRTFKPFRFAELREGNDDSSKHQIVTTNPEFLTFGYGRYACPGRFFVANELKCMLAHVVLNYDVKFEDGQDGYPPNRMIESVCAPADVNVLFRKRNV